MFEIVKTGSSYASTPRNSRQLSQVSPGEMGHTRIPVRRTPLAVFSPTLREISLALQISVDRAMTARCSR